MLIGRSFSLITFCLLPLLLLGCGPKTWRGFMRKNLPGVWDVEHYEVSRPAGTTGHALDSAGRLVFGRGGSGRAVLFASGDSTLAYARRNIHIASSRSEPVTVYVEGRLRYTTVFGWSFADTSVVVEGSPLAGTWRVTNGYSNWQEWEQRRGDTVWRMYLRRL